VVESSTPGKRTDLTSHNTMTTCKRCGTETDCTSISIFNRDAICVECKDAERHHPRYRAACDAEIEAIRRGEADFPGIGFTPEQDDSVRVFEGRHR
jgi:hypothetical protein